MESTNFSQPERVARCGLLAVPAHLQTRETDPSHFEDFVFENTPRNLRSRLPYDFPRNETKRRAYNLPTTPPAVYYFAVERSFRPTGEQLSDGGSRLEREFVREASEEEGRGLEPSSTLSLLKPRPSSGKKGRVTWLA